MNSVPMPRTHRRIPVAVAALLLVGNGLSAPVARAADDPPCMGAEPTVLLTAGAPDYTDTEGLDDVVLDVDGVANQIITGDGDDIVCAADGDDVVDLGAGRDRVDGGAGDDEIDGGHGHDLLLAGGDGDDFIIGRAGNDRLEGGDGNDVLVGRQGDDTMLGDAGDDVLIGNAGDDDLDGGPGLDRLFGQEGNDTLAGGDDDDRIRGGPGDDTADGGLGSDILRGEDGKDTLAGGDGPDRLFGDANADKLYGGLGADVLRTGEGDETLGFGNPYRNDQARGGDGDDILVGGSQRDWLWGGAGIDRILGRGGNDIIVSGSGADSSYGGPGYDQLWSGSTTGVNADVDAVVNGGGRFDACEAAVERVKCEDPHGQRDVEYWRPLVTEVFTSWGIEQEVDNALAIIRCESVGDPFSRNVSSDTRGLFQHRPFAIESQAPKNYFWGERVQQVIDGHLDKAVGFPSDPALADPFDPVHNANMAALLVWQSINHPEWGGPWGDSFAWYPWGHWHCGEITYGVWVAQAGDPAAWLMPNEY